MIVPLYPFPKNTDRTSFFRTQKKQKETATKNRSNRVSKTIQRTEDKDCRREIRNSGQVPHAGAPTVAG